MNMYELLVLAVGLSMDAFAVAICKGLAIRTVSLKHAAWVGLWFGGFQMLMPLLGFLLAHSFAQAIASFDHWIAFLLLAVIGGNMIREALKRSPGICPPGPCSCWPLPPALTPWQPASPWWPG